MSNMRLPKLGIPPAEKSNLARLFQGGALPQAQKVASRLTAQYPLDGFSSNISGLISQASGDFFAARDHFAEALKRTPGSVDYAANLGYILSDIGDSNQAVSLLTPFVRKFPKHINARTNLIRAIFETQHVADALPHVAKLKQLTGNTAETLRIQGTALTFTKDFENALPILIKSRELAPKEFKDYRYIATCMDALEGPTKTISYLQLLIKDPLTGPGAHVALANHFALIGDFPNAIIHFEEALKQAPDQGKIYVGLGRLRKWTADDPHLKSLEQLATRPDIHEGPKGDALFALGKAYRDLGRTKDSFEAILKANAAHRKLTQFDGAHMKKAFLALPSVVFGAKPQPLLPTLTPVFIISLPRNGSTLVEHILSRHPDIATMGEDSTVYNAANQTMSTGNLKKLSRVALSHYQRAANGKPVVTDKFLNNYMCLSALAEALPNAKFIDVHKEPAASGYSLLTSPLSAVGHPFAFSQEDIADYIAAQRKLMQAWKVKYPNRIIDLSYEALVSQPDQKIPELLKQLDLSNCDDCLSPEESTRQVDTFSLVQVRQKITTAYQSRWKAHEEQLQPMLTRLAAHGL
ncbi:MAG: sulfotransferase [Pseudoruegeria sp.]